MCDYELRGLPEPRCPECGYVFDWAELREQARRRQLWFYEHSGTVRSMLQTRLRSLWPASFWGGIHAYSDAHRGRLRRYGVVTVVLFVALGIICWVVQPVVGEWAYDYRYMQVPSYSNYSWRGMTAVPPPPWYAMPLVWASGYLSLNAVQDVQPLTAGVGMAVAWPIALWAYLGLLRGSVLQARIKPVHLTRIRAYSADVLPLLVPLFAIVAVAGGCGLEAWRHYQYSLSNANAFRSWQNASFAFYAAVLPMTLVVPLGLRLHGALRRYVRFPHAGRVALGFVVIMTLAWAILSLTMLTDSMT